VTNEVKTFDLMMSWFIDCIPENRPAFRQNMEETRLQFNRKHLVAQFVPPTGDQPGRFFERARKELPKSDEPHWRIPHPDPADPTGAGYWTDTGLGMVRKVNWDGFVAACKARDDAIVDNFAVDRFAKMMKDKLGLKRGQGYGGWWDSAEVSEEQLASMLAEHVVKGDMIDVMNLAMMIYMRAEFGRIFGPDSQKAQDAAPKD
jgi:hypothetical protein